MSAFFIGANYGGTDHSQTCVKNGLIAIGFTPEEAPPIHRVFDSITAGDLVVIKSYSPSSGLFVKAVGVCSSSTKLFHPELRHCKEVMWLWMGNEALGTFSDYYTNMRTGTLYVEQNEVILKKIVDLIRPE